MQDNRSRIRDRISQKCNAVIEIIFCEEATKYYGRAIGEATNEPRKINYRQSIERSPQKSWVSAALTFL